MSTESRSGARLAALDALVHNTLLPQVQAIDREGAYPREFLHAFGRLGGFSAAIAPAWGGQGGGLAEQIDAIASVGRACGTTAFLVWCQAACAWYLQQAPNEEPRRLYLQRVATGAVLAGTGMSNMVKHLAGIERVHLRATREAGGYRVSGALPWVSNIGEGHLLIVAAAVEQGGYVMFVLPPGGEQPVFHPCPDFAGLAGSATYNVRLHEAWVPDHDVLAHPAQFEAFVRRIKPGFTLAQIGVAQGIVEASIRTMHESGRSHAHVNRYLDEQADTLALELAGLLARVRELAGQDASAPMLDVLRARAHASELSLRASQAAALHAGARGYLMRHPAQRRLREALFVAIVTPALKHLRKEIDALQAVEAA